MIEENDQEDFEIKYKDSSTDIVGLNANGNVDFTYTNCGNLIGMKCNFRCKNGGCAAANADIDKLSSCQLIHDFPVVSYSFVTTIADFTYTLYDGQTSQKKWETTNNLCYSEVYTQTYVKDGTTLTSKPACITVSNSLGDSYLTVTSTSNADVGVYVITITGTLGGLNDPNTSLPWVITTTFTLTIQSDCVNTSLTTHAINNMSVLVSQSDT